jgi:hypothetical protein
MLVPSSPTSQPLSSLVLQHLLIRQTKPVFQGKGQGKGRFREEQEKLVSDLKQAGVTREVLKEKWQVVLWFVRDQGDKIRLLVESQSKDFNPEAFQNWLKSLLTPIRPGTQFDIKVKEHDLDKCCDKRCDGCLAGSKEHRKEWVK